MNKRSYIVCIALFIVFSLSYLLHQQQTKAQSQKDLAACIARFEKIYFDSIRIKPVALKPFFEKTGKWGYKDLKGNVVIKPQFSEARNFLYGRASVTHQTWKGFIDGRGELAIPYQFVWVSDFSKGVAIFSGTKEDKDLQGVIDVNGQIVLTFKGASPAPDFAGFDESGRTSVYIHDDPWAVGNPVSKKYGSLDCTGRIIW
jgi:WG containing repeat